MKNKVVFITLIIVTIIAIVCIAFFIIGYNNSKEVNLGITQLAVDSDGQVLTAEDIITMMKAQDIADNWTSGNGQSYIGRVVTYTSETDINELLGRPNQYTSKSTFEDTRLEQENLLLDPEEFSLEEIYEPTGGTIEVFENEADMQKRKSYLKSVTSSFSPLAEYSYSEKNVLLRLNKQLTPEQAKHYEELFYAVIK